jgi:hypothetical protein
MKSISRFHREETGSAGTKLLIAILVIAILANAGLNYVPVAYEGENFKQEMHTAVVNGMALPGQMKPLETIKSRLQRAASDNRLPADAVMEIKQVGTAVQAHVAYQKEVSILPFGIYDYTYTFDHTVTPTGFLTKE